MAINGSSAAFQLRVSKVSALDTTVMTALGDGNVGIATTTPWGLLSINPNGIIGPAFVIGSSTATHLIVTNGGEVGIGLTTPDANYKITTTGGGIKAENSSASQPAGYFSNAGGGPALMIGTGGFVTETRTSDPASPVTGQIWLRTDL